MSKKADPKPIQILLIEDNPRDVFFVDEALKNQGLDFKLNVVEDGEEALSYLRRLGKHARAARPDLILLDLNLPKHDGLVILQKIRENSSLENVPVAVLTTSAWPEDKVNTTQLGADAYIRKPSKLEEFMKIGATLKGLLTTPERTPKE